MAADFFSFTVEHPSVTHTIIRLVGEIDMLTAPDFRACLDEHLATHTQNLILNCTGVTFFGSTGLVVLLELKQVAEKQCTKLYLVDAGNSVMRVLEVTGLAEMFSDEPPPP